MSSRKSIRVMCIVLNISITNSIFERSANMSEILLSTIWVLICDIFLSSCVPQHEYLNILNY